MAENFQVDFQPIGRRGKAPPGQTLLDAAHTAGMGLASVCGGAGTCAQCRLRLVHGELTPPTPVEQAALGEADLAAGYRLACQAWILSDVRLEVPPDSLTAEQRLQLEGEEPGFDRLPAAHAPGAYGLAVDIGTTKLAAYLVDLAAGTTVARRGAMNPQIAYGEDVVSRVAFAGREPDGRRRLQAVLVETLNELLHWLCATCQLPPEKVVDAVLVGNTAMHHLAAGLPVEQLGHAPFAPATTAPIVLVARDLGLDLAPEAQVYLPPVVAGYVGADHLAMLLATGAWKSPGTVVAMDIGTNTEISLVRHGRVTCCSCASGPAFEGAHIREGMRAASGAIERARWSQDRVLWQTIDGQPPVGICGSGILDVVAALLDGGLVNPNGKLVPGAEYTLVPAAQTGLGRDLLVTRRDINEIQLAKSAIRSGTEALLAEAGLTAAEVDDFVIAGAFGTYLDLRSGQRVGMFPPLPLERFRQVGNAAGVGARQMLVSVEQRRAAEELGRQLGYVELATNPQFTDRFMKHLSFEA